MSTGKPLWTLKTSRERPDLLRARLRSNGDLWIPSVPTPEEGTIDQSRPVEPAAIVVCVWGLEVQIPSSTRTCKVTFLILFGVSKWPVQGLYK